MIHKIEISYKVVNTVVEYNVQGDVILFGDVLEIEYGEGLKLSTAVKNIVSLKIDGKMLDRSFQKNVEALIDSSEYPSKTPSTKKRVNHSCTVRFFRSCQECCQIFSSVMITASESGITLMDYRFVNNSFYYREILEMSIDGKMIEFDGELDYAKMNSVLNNLR